MTDPKAELAVKKLARLPSNTVCPNCGTQKKFGFSAVCIKFLTFVCNDCKSSHAAYSHRCKSLTMSAWTKQEVAALERAGNDVARKTWLARAPPCGKGGRPKPGDLLDVYKQFVLNAYEHKRYYQEATEEEEESDEEESEEEVQPAPRTSTIRAAPRAAVPAKSNLASFTPAPDTKSNFASFAPAVKKPPTSNHFASFPPAPAAPVATPAPDLLAFDGNSGSSNAAALATNNDAFDPFANKNNPKQLQGQASFSSAKTEKATNVSTTPAFLAAAGSTFDPFGNNNAAANNTTQTSAFAIMEHQQPAQQQQSEEKKTVMSNNSGNSISAMGYFMNGSSNNNNNGMSMGMNNGMGGGMNNNGGVMNNGMAMAMNNNGGMNNGMAMGMNQGGGMNQNTNNMAFGMNNIDMMPQQQQMMMQQRQMMMMQQQQQQQQNMMQQQQQQNMMQQQQQQQQQPVMNFGAGGASSSGATISAMTPQSTNAQPKHDPFSNLF